MSSVVISGDVSGSVTLQAPSAAGTTVLTLPATSGTIVTGPGGVTQITAGGTGQTTATAAFDALNPMTTAGDIIYESAPGTATRLPVGSTGQVLTVAGGLPTWAAAGGGSIQTQLFTSPGTWTKPSSVTQVRVTVVGGGGGSAWNGAGTPGGTSSFGPLATATGGSGQPYPATGTGSDGTGSTTGTLFRSANIKGFNSPTANNALAGSFGMFSGLMNVPTPGAPGAGYTWTTSSNYIAGANGGLGSGTGVAGGGGICYAQVPVSAPVSVTVGTGGPGGGPGTAAGGYSGAVLVEWVG